MADTEKKRVIRSKDERKAEIDKKIQYHKDCIKALEEKKANLDKPTTRGNRAKGIKRMISEAKLSDEETAKALGMSLDELKEKNYEKVAIFAHGGVLICAQLYAGAIKQEEAFSALTPYGGIIQLRLD